MNRICENIEQIRREIGNVQLVVVSKFRSNEELQQVYACGHRHFAENRVQEILRKRDELPGDIQWHIIGHLQTNKVKQVIPFIHLIHSVDSVKLLEKINEEAKKNDKIQEVLLQIHIAQEEHKYGFTPDELHNLMSNDQLSSYSNISCKGLMGMATFTDEQDVVRNEFKGLKSLYDRYAEDHGWNVLSMGMSGDYEIAVEEGSTMLRIGSLIFA